MKEVVNGLEVSMDTFQLAQPGNGTLERSEMFIRDLFFLADFIISYSNAIEGSVTISFFLCEILFM